MKIGSEMVMRQDTLKVKSESRIFYLNFGANYKWKTQQNIYKEKNEVGHPTDFVYLDLCQFMF